MRKILYRARELKTNDWIYGYPLRFGFPGQEKWFLLPTYASSFYEMEIDPETISQWTGLTDSAGAKIFEGDVLHAIEEGGTSSILVTVIWNEEYSRFDLNEDLTGYPEESSLVYLMEAYEYVYLLWKDDDNPELLKGGKE